MFDAIDWEDVQAIVDRTLSDVPVYVYDRENDIRQFFKFQLNGHNVALNQTFRGVEARLRKQFNEDIEETTVLQIGSKKYLRIKLRIHRANNGSYLQEKWYDATGIPVNNPRKTR